MTNFARFVKGHEQSEHHIKLPSRGELERTILIVATAIDGIRNEGRKQRVSIMERLINLNEKVATLARSGSGVEPEIA
ncbi:hypothetical protein BC830DRAFT_1101979 [Chytriomyces sp. MP71]|nr:hypothetical protein BC830DRAFT_1101979 [Chytriomyces sp. MP71]